MKLVLSVSVLVCMVQCLPMAKDELEDFSNFLLKTSSLDIHVKSADPEDSYDEFEVVSDDAWEESGKFEGDLILNDRQRKLIVENVEGLSRNGLSDSTKRWPNNEVIYFIQREHFTSGQVQAIQDGIDDLARASCVKFRPYKKGDRDAVVIQGSRRGCFSQVGYQGGYQVLNLSGRHPVGRGCFRHGTVVHELLHTLGFYHMQSSPDRDDYIDVIWANIVQPARHNFRKYNSFSVSDFGVGYDYDSVLHYGRRAFSANGQDTLVPKKSGAEIGQRIGLSDKDTQKLNKMYCDADNDAAIQADETPTKKQKNKKKKPKNQPFEGHGIGYHQGKTVVIKLPVAETYKLANVPSTPVFDFSKTPQVVSPEAGGYRFGEEIIQSYKPVTSVNNDTSGDNNKLKTEHTNKNIELQDTKEKEDVEPLKEDKNDDSSQRSNHSGEFKPKHVPIDDYDKDLEDAYHRITKIVKQSVYPQNYNDDNKINKDYSKFFRPIKPLSSHTKSDLDDRFERTVTHSLPKIQIQENLDDKRSPLQDKVDGSYRTVVPTKRPYSSYEQTETPHYATLEYLKNRHDYSDVYAPNSPYRNEDKDEDTKKEFKDISLDVKINPYGQGFYTDSVLKDNKGPQVENHNNVEKPLKYVREEAPNEKRKERIDSSFRTILPTSKPYSAYEYTETPKYAKLDYLKDRHDISDVYSPRNLHNHNRKEKEPYTIEDPPTDSDWYTKDSYKHNPANYDQDSYSDYVQKKQNGQKKDERDDYDKESKSESLYKPNAEYSSKEDEEKSNSKETSSEYKQPKYADDFDYFAKYQKGVSDGHSGYDEYNSKDYKNKPRDDYSSEELKYVNHYPKYEKESFKSEKISEENRKESPKRSEAYNLYGVPVPTTNDWYKVNYEIPESETGENTS